jgi:hypothetical protein
MIEQLKIYWAEKKYRVIFAAILVAALCMRLMMFLWPMEYDEFWTIGYTGSSVGRILTDLATPNNHPLNTLFVKFWRSCFDIVQLIRLHSLVFGMLSVVLTGMLARGLFHSRVPALLSMLFMAFDAAAVYYSDQARGYSAQLFFLLLFACGIAYGGRLRKFLPWKYLPEAAVIVGALGAVLSVPSAPIFLAAAVIAARVGRRKLPDASMLISVGIAAALVAIYLGSNQADLRAAQAAFGKRLNDFSEWSSFLFDLFKKFCPLAVAPFLMVIAATDRKRGAILLACTAVIVLSPALTGAGPTRVYLPLCVPIALGAGRGAHALLTVANLYNNRKLARLLILAVVFLAGFGFYQMYEYWHITDYCRWLEAGQSQPPKCLIVYPATAGLPLKLNNDMEKLLKDQRERLSFDESGTRRMLCFGVEPGEINCGNPLEASYPEMVLALSVKGTPMNLNGFPAVEYRLYPTDAPHPGEEFVAVLLSKEAASRLVDSGCTPFVLNPHFLNNNLIVSVAPQTAVKWDEIRDAGAKFYTFAPQKAAAPKP